MSGLGVNKPGQVMTRIPSSKNTKDLYQGRTERPVSGTPFGLTNGFLYVMFQNRYELVKPKTFEETGSVDGLVNLIRFAAMGLEGSTAVEQYLASIMYMSVKQDEKYQFYFERPYINGKAQKSGIKAIVFGGTKLTLQDLENVDKINELKEFLKDKYWNFSRKHLEGKYSKGSFIEYYIEVKDRKPILKQREWTAKDGAYKGFLFNSKNSKGTISIKKIENPTNLRMAKDPLYKNQSINLSEPTIGELPVVQKQPQVSSATSTLVNVEPGSAVAQLMGNVGTANVPESGEKVGVITVNASEDAPSPTTPTGSNALA